MNGFMQRRASPVRQGRAPEIGDRVEAHMLRMPLVAELDSGHEGHFVDRSPPRLARKHPAEVGVVGDNLSRQQTARFALGYGLYELLLRPPGGAVTHAQTPLERDRGEVAPVLRDPVDRLKNTWSGTA